jgi:WD40 repeat protein/uncharacterized caspase-like protein
MGTKNTSQRELSIVGWPALVLVVVLFTAAAGPTFGQTPSATPTPDNRGLGVQTSGATSNSQSGAQSREAKPELVLQTGYNSFIGATRLVFSPDGRLLATGTFRSSTIKLWDTTTGRELRDLSSGTQSAMGMSPYVAFSRDSRLVAAAAGDNSVRIWDVTSGRELQTLTGSQGSFAASIGVYFIAFTGDGQIVTVSDAIRVWDVASGAELRTLGSTSENLSSFTGGDGSVAISPDGKQFASAATSSDKPVARIWDISSGRELRSIELADEESGPAEIAFTSDGRLLVSAIVNKQIKLWDSTANRSERKFGLTNQEFAPVKFSRDGRQLVLVENYALRRWDTSTGQELPALNVPNSGLLTSQVGAIVGFSLSEDGKRIATGGFDTPTILWDLETGKQILKLTGRTNMAYKVGFSADGTQLSSGGRTRWDLRTGRGLRITASPPDRPIAISSPDGKLLATFAPNNNTVSILEIPSGRQLQTLKPASGGGVVQRASFSPDGTILVTTYGIDQAQMQKAAGFGQGAAGNENQVKLWDVKTGLELRSLMLGTTATEANFSGDGKMLAIIGSMGQLSLWDTASGNKLRDLSTSPMAKVMNSMPNMGNLSAMDPKTMKQMAKRGSMPTMPNIADITAMMSNVMGTMSAGTMGRSITSLAFSPDGKILATGGVESTTNMDQLMADAMNPAKQKKNAKQTSTDPAELMKSLKVEAIGQVQLWDVATGQEIGALKGHGKGVTQVAFSRDGRFIASSSSDNTIKLWDVAARRELRTLSGHTTNIDSMDFSPDGRLLASASDDGGTFLWDTNTGEHLLTLISLDDGGEWMVVTPQGLFDGTPVSWNQILWRYNQDTFNVAPIEWFFNEFYYPGLLADVLAGKRPTVSQDVSKKDRRQPIVKLSLVGDPPSALGITSRTVKVKIEVTDAPADKDNPQSSGARDVRLFRNGSLVRVWHGDVLKGQSSVTLEEEITMTAGANRLTAYAFNRDNVKSKDAQLPLTGADSLKRAGTAYIIAVGINEYANPQYNLKYAVADAQSFAEEVRLRQSQVGQFEHIEVLPLINENATKANILAALGRLSGTPAPPTMKASPLDRFHRAEPEDTVIIYFAGHGTAQSQRFYLIPHDLGYPGERTKLNEQGLKTILAHSISDVELEAAVENLDAGHLLLVIDACNSGQALEAEEKRRGPMNSKGLAQLAYEKGMYILTAAQSYQAALEAAQFGHGLLTYALLEEGLKTPVADREPKDGVLIVREWLDFATERVPQLQEEKMKQSRGVGKEISFAEGEQHIPDPDKRSVQRPRVFYRRELEAHPLVIAKP